MSEGVISVTTTASSFTFNEEYDYIEVYNEGTVTVSVKAGVSVSATTSRLVQPATYLRIFEKTNIVTAICASGTSTLRVVGVNFPDKQ